jgi:hypothetical protein
VDGLGKKFHNSVVAHWMLNQLSAGREFAARGWI